MVIVTNLVGAAREGDRLPAGRGDCVDHQSWQRWSHGARKRKRVAGYQHTTGANRRWVEEHVDLSPQKRHERSATRPAAVPLKRRKHARSAKPAQRLRAPWSDAVGNIKQDCWAFAGPE